MTKRIFIAIDISEQAREKLTGFTGGLKRDLAKIRVGWEKPEKIHLTLKFLGDIDEDQLSGVKEAAMKAAAGLEPFPVTIENTGCFPSPGKARILWLGVTDQTGNLRKLKEALEEKIAALGFEKETRPFAPHLTIARLREPQRSRELAEAWLQKQFEPVSFEVSAIVIYESKLLPAGSVYSVIETFNL
jgi:2'-5' RNA ligase